MKLILDLLGPPRLMGARTRCELRSGSLTIGRSPEADWVIPDVDRMISRRHLRIDASHGAFVLTDMSANGVFINASDAPLGFGASAGLANGDHLRVGEASIAVTIEAEAGASAPMPTAAAPAIDARKPLPAAHDVSDGPFGVDAKPVPESRPPEAEQAKAASPQTIDANWMIAAQPATAASRLPSREAEHAARPSGASPKTAQPSEETWNSAPAAASLLDLVERTPDLSIRRLAEAIDDARPTMGFALWQAFYDRVSHLVRV